MNALENVLPVKARKSALIVCETEHINADELTFIESVRHNSMILNGKRFVFSFGDKLLHIVVFSKSEIPSFRNKLWKYGITGRETNWLEIGSFKEIEPQKRDFFACGDL